MSIKRSLVVAIMLLGGVATALFATGAAEQGADTVEEVTVFVAGNLTFPTGDPVWSENPVGQWIEEETGIRVIIDVPSTGSSADEKLNLLLASGDYPQMFVTNSLTTVTRSIDEGIAVELDGLLEQHGPNILATYGENIDRLRWTDGSIYYIGSKPGLPEGFAGPATGYGSGGFSIRKDIYEGIGSPEINTIDDIHDVARMIAEQYPTTSTGERIWPLGAFYQTWQNIRDSLAMGAGFYASGKWYLDSRGDLHYWTRGPQAITIAEHLNTIYREGLLDPEYITIDRATWTTKLANGRVVAGYNPWWMNWTTHTALAAGGFGNADDLIFLNFPFSVPGGQAPRFVEISSFGGPYKVVTTALDEPELGVQLLDYLAVPENAFVANNGIEGGMWDWVGNRPVMRDEFIQQFNAGAGDTEFAMPYGYRLYHNLATNPGNEVPTPWDTFWILKDDPIATGNERAAERDRLFSPTWYDVTPFAEMMKGMSEELSGIWTRAEEMLMNDFYRVVTANSARDFRTAWANFLAELDAIGIARVEEFVNSNYQAYMHGE